MGRDRRRQPQRVPLTRDIGNTAHIRKVIDAQHYLLDIGSRVGSPVIAFYIGSLVLVEGERVLATWREESSLWEIVGPIREPAQATSGFLGVGFEEVSGGGSDFMHILGVGTDGTIGEPIADPATQPTATVERIVWSHNGQWIAIAYSDQLSIYEWNGQVIGDRLANVTLVDNNWAGNSRLGLAWNFDDTFLAVGHDRAATGEGLSVFSWDGVSALVEEDRLTTSGSILGVDWHPTENVIATSWSDGPQTIISWNGTTLVIEDFVNTAVAVWDAKWRPDGLFVAFGGISGDRLRIYPWDQATLSLGAEILPASQLPSAAAPGITWNVDGTLIVAANSGTDNLVGYTFNGIAFGSRILHTLPGALPIGNDVMVHPGGAYFAVAYETTGAGDQYVATVSFDGAAFADIDQRSSGGAVHLDGFAIGFPPGGVVPTEQLDASEITYAPDDVTDWDVTPDDVAEALDELADRLTGLLRIADLPLGSFVVHTGAPAYAQVGTNMHAWAFDDTADELIVYSFTVPPKYASGGFFRLYYVMASAVANDVVVSADALAAAEGDDFDAAGTAATVTDAVQAGGATDLGIVDVTPVVTYVANERVRVIAGRLGADGSDNAVGDMWLVGIEFRYTATL